MHYTQQLLGLSTTRYGPDSHYSVLPNLQGHTVGERSNVTATFDPILLADYATELVSLHDADGRFLTASAAVARGARPARPPT